jgi:hypothetical protein
VESEIQDGCQGLIFYEKNDNFACWSQDETCCFHIENMLSKGISYAFDEFQLKSEIQNGSFPILKMTHLPLDHHGD